jgi:hypothetical protein
MSQAGLSRRNLARERIAFILSSRKSAQIFPTESIFYKSLPNTSADECEA